MFDFVQICLLVHLLIYFAFDLIVDSEISGFRRTWIFGMPQTLWSKSSVLEYWFDLSTAVMLFWFCHHWLQWLPKSSGQTDENYWTVTKIFNLITAIICIVTFSMCTIQHLEVDSGWCCLKCVLTSPCSIIVAATVIASWRLVMVSITPSSPLRLCFSSWWTLSIVMGTSTDVNINSTVGYGDFYPHSYYGKFFMIFVILLGLCHTILILILIFNISNL